MPAVSKKQRRMMGLVHAIQTGKKDLKDVPEKFREKVGKAVKSLSKKEANKFAKTKEKGLPETVEEKLTFKDFIIVNGYLEENMKLAELVLEKKEEESKDTSHNTSDENFHKVLAQAKDHEVEAMALSPKRPTHHRLLALKKLKGKDVTEKDLDAHRDEVRARVK